MSTLGQLKAKIADDLARGDLTSQIADAITEAIVYHSKERFWFNEYTIANPATFSTVSGRALYGAADSASIPLLIRLDTVFATIGGNLFPLRSSDPAELYYLNNNGGSGSQGQPIAYAHDGSSLTIYPVPNGTYTVSLLGHYRLDVPTSDAGSNAWTTEALELIRATAKASLNANVIREIQSAEVYEGIAARHLDALRRETARRTMRGRIKPWE